MKEWGSRILLLSVLCAWAQGAPTDDTVVETPNDWAGEEEEPVDALPDWLIDIPAEDEEGASRGLRPMERKQYIVADEHVVSQSRMFSVSGGDALRVGAIASHADDIRMQLNRLLGIDDKWKYLVSVRVLGTTADTPRANPIRMRVRIIGNEPNIQIRVFAGGGINVAGLDKALISALLYEYALRGLRPDALPDVLEMPPWLVTGLQQTLLWKQGRIDRRYYERLFKKGDMVSPEKIIDTADPEELEAGALQVYEVACGVLVMGLLQQNSGAERLRALLADALTEEGSTRRVITAYFHEMGVDNNNFNKWWALALATLAMPHPMDVLTPLETEKQLDEMLQVTGLDSEKRVPYLVKVTDMEALKKLPDWQYQVRGCIDMLTELSTHCFPGYRSVIMEYLRALGEMLSGADQEKVDRIVTPLEELRRAYKAASVRGRDYLDWFEITRLGNSGNSNFSSYLDTMRLLRKESPGPATPISRYLDDIETLHGLKEGEALPAKLLRRKDDK